ncbi:SDR family NAD(P)-dependent oxidoreductase [Deinococcus ruber]|uniref:Short-chain dehydrogenase n=1 Tax=Deinococcus ruber TaxID=1848197 RepID=A0A918F2F8_9DEIO|nr:SDR family NAD(P)-dependent oxidoreductase [Deinococcus ruber]GGQ95348.1 short-chain dehydrogenase [Deinococcus ruber]
MRSPAPERRTVVLITGASSGIGEATARVLAPLGYALALTARREDLLTRLAHSIDPGNTHTLVFPADLSEEAERSRLIEGVLERFGRIDVLINNAGVTIPSGRWWNDPDPLRVIDLNLKVPADLTRRVLPAMLERRSGQIVNIGSVAGRVATHGMYSASKFGLRGFSLALRRELLGSGVDVSLVAPGFVRTAFTSGARLPMPGPDVVAQTVARVLTRPTREAITPAWYGPLALLDALAPSLTDHVVRRVMKRRYQGASPRNTL